MSQNPSPDTAGRAYPSSPFVGSDDTLYSPELVRLANRARAAAATNQLVPVQNPAQPVNTTGGPVAQVVPETASICYIGLTPQPHQLGLFTNELESDNRATFVSRYIFVSNASWAPLSYDSEAAVNDIVGLIKSYTVFTYAALFWNNGVYLRLDSLTDACDAVLICQGLNYQANYVDSYDYARAKTQDTIAMNEFDAQIKLVVRVTAINQKQKAFTLDDLAWVNHTVGNFVQAAFGELLAFVHVGTDEAAMLFTYRIEFDSVDASHRAVASINLDAEKETRADNLWKWATVSAAAWNGPRAPNSPHRHKIHYDDLGRMTLFRHQPTSPHGQKGNNAYPSESHNRVHKERILDGTDVRTTVMLRNIPNKIDWMALKNILDDVCFGTYDFLYLRIDFKTCNNVGYAFINFVDIKGMIAILDKVEGRGWKGFKSNKFAEISYATIQGKEALIQKFRNSSVMSESPFCHPHLFMTYQDAMAKMQKRNTGTVEKFPAPDNHSKLQRSLNSARAVGLFPPSGIINANIQRAMVSAYDRGTPRDLMHTMNAYRQHQDASDQGISQYERRQCEAWYATKAGLDRNGATSFNDIPYGSVQQFLAMTRGAHRGNNLGPIAPPRAILPPQSYYTAPNANYNTGMMVRQPAVRGGHPRGVWPNVSGRSNGLY